MTTLMVFSVFCKRMFTSVVSKQGFFCSSPEEGHQTKAPPVMEEWEPKRAPAGPSRWGPASWTWTSVRWRTCVRLKSRRMTPTWGSVCRCRYDGISTFIQCLTLHLVTSLRSITRSHLVLLQPIVCIPGFVHFFYVIYYAVSF